MAGATGRAVAAVAVFAAGVRLAAAMPPGVALKLPADRQRSGVEIDMLPAEPECLPLPKSVRVPSSWPGK